MGGTYEQMEAKRKGEYDQAQEISKKATKGYENNVPCPWCGKRNDHTMLASAGGREAIKEGDLSDKSLYIDCDHCGNLMYVCRVVTTPVISVKQYHKQPKPEYEPRNREAWEAEQEEARRVTKQNEAIALERQEKMLLLGVDADLIDQFAHLPPTYVKRWVDTRNKIGRDNALGTLPELSREYAQEQSPQDTPHGTHKPGESR